MAGRNARTAKPQVSATHAAGTARQSAVSEAERAAPRSAPREPRSDAMRLAAELELLKTELAAARAAVAALETQAQVDVLTGILNRRGFTRELDRAVAYVTRYGARAALVYLDSYDLNPADHTGPWAHGAASAGLATRNQQPDSSPRRSARGDVGGHLPAELSTRRVCACCR